MNPDLIRYIRENSGTYTRDALDGQLLAAGYSREEIDAAWQEASGAAAPGTSSRAAGLEDAARRRVSCLGVFSVLFTGLLLFLTLLGFSLADLNSVYSRRNALNIVLIVLIVLSGVGALGFFAYGRRMVRQERSVGYITTALLLGTFLWYAVIIGTCLFAPTVVPKELK